MSHISSSHTLPESISLLLSITNKLEVAKAPHKYSNQKTDHLILIKKKLVLDEKCESEEENGERAKVA